MPEWSIGAVSKTVVPLAGTVGSNPTLSAIPVTWSVTSPKKPEQPVARKKQPVISYVMFDVFYQDGTRTSHRKVPAAEPHEADYNARVKAIIEAQDREIAEKSGRPRGPIKSIVRVAGQ